MVSQVRTGDRYYYQPKLSRASTKQCAQYLYRITTAVSSSRAVHRAVHRATTVFQLQYCYWFTGGTVIQAVLVIVV